MGISILVLKEEAEAYAFSEKLQKSSTQVVSLELIVPTKKIEEPSQEKIEQKQSILEEKNYSLIKKVLIDDVKLLNPKLSQKNRQRTMSLWLMPFGLIAGLTFSGMTNLNTFSRLGFGSFGEIIIGGLLGMGSGWIGSFFAATSVNPYKKDVESLRKRNQQGRWLVLLETPFESELPWGIIKELNPIEVVRLSEI